MRYLTLGEVLELHHRIILRWGGASRIRDLGALESAVAQPRMTFGGSDLCSDLIPFAFSGAGTSDGTTYGGFSGLSRFIEITC